MIKINKWSETFENADSRKRQRLGFFYAPSGCDSSGYLTLMSEFPQDDALMALGVFMALCQIAATGRKDERGAFFKSDGTAMSLKQVAMLIRCQEKHLSKAIKILADERVNWVSCHESAADLPPDCQTPADSIPKNSEDSPIVQGQGEGQGEGEVSCPASPDVLAEIWKMVPPISRTRSSQEKVKKAWAKIKVANRPSLELLTEALTAWNLTEKWKDGFSEGLHIWINDKQWLNIPKVESKGGPTGSRVIEFGGRVGKVQKIGS